MEKIRATVNKWMSEIITIGLFLLNLCFILGHIALAFLLYIPGSLTNNQIVLAFSLIFISALVCFFILYRKVLLMVYAREIINDE